MKFRSLPLKLICLVFFFFGLSSQKLQAQEAPFMGRQQSVGAAVLHSTFADSLLAGTNLKGKGTGISYAYSFTTAGRKTILTGAYESLSLQDPAANVRAHSFAASLSDGFRIFKNADRNFYAYVGYSLQTRPMYVTASGKDVNRFSWNTLNTIGLYQSYAYVCKKQVLSIDVEVTLLGAGFRPERTYSIQEGNSFNEVVADLYSNRSFISLKEYRALDIAASYRLQCSQRFDLSLRYRWQYRKGYQETGFLQKENSLGLSVVYKMK